MTQLVKEESETSSKVTTKECVTRFHTAIGWNEKEKSLEGSAPLAAATWDEIVQLSSSALASCGIKDAYIKVKKWHENLGDIHADDKPLIPNLSGFMKHLRQQGLYIAICTSDDRQATEACIRNWGLNDLIDVSSCI